MSAGSAWYEADRATFVGDDLERVVGELTTAAAHQGLHIEPSQAEEWESSVELLQSELEDQVLKVELLRSALAELEDYQHVILEYDFRRRGLRMDCVLLGKGVVVVIEFKRASIARADRDQVSNYCINLVEFHEETQRACRDEGCVVIPVVALTNADVDRPVRREFHHAPWSAVLRDPLECGKTGLRKALASALALRRSHTPLDRKAWLASRFSPSSSIIDAAVSLYGQHTVSAIARHASSVEQIERCTQRVVEWAVRSTKDKKKRIVFVSGAPGAGKTLVGLKLAFHSDLRSEAVFVTGNAPLVDVLRAALKESYRARRRNDKRFVITGYPRKEAHQQVIRMSTFKIVKAHDFLGERGKKTGSIDGRVVIFDEAQRTYKQGRMVLRKKLEHNEADLILRSLERSYGDGAVVVALLGHNQAINRGELGVAAWFQAAHDRGWTCVIADETLELTEVREAREWLKRCQREVLEVGHLDQSLRYYRNERIEQWAACVLDDDDPTGARSIAEQFAAEDTVWVVRDLATARSWARSRRVGDERSGIIASGQARRLAAEGLFVDFKPDIANWMLAPSADIRSSSMLETVQNQYQIQGLEIDYSIVCWDLDLRREDHGWKAYKLDGDDWKVDTAVGVAKNGYRVLLTRARRGMVVFVPRGDGTEVDVTRSPPSYDAIAKYLVSCGAKQFDTERPVLMQRPVPRP